MSDAPLQPVRPAAAEAPRPSRRRTVWRWSRRLLAVVVAVVAALVVTSFSIDLGPSLRGLAERQATKYLERPMHIGKVSALLRLGEFELDDIRIEGLTPSDRPFLVAKQVTVYVPWWTVFNRDLIIEDVHMTGWSMVIESYANGRSSQPKLMPKPGGGKTPFTMTTHFIHTDNGEFTYDDHGAPWSIVGRHLSVNVFKARDGYRGAAYFSNGTVQIQKFQPMSADFNMSFKIAEHGIVQLERILLKTDGAVSKIAGSVDFPRWPEMTFNVDSRVDFRRMRDLFWHDSTFELEGDGGFKGVYHVFKGGRSLKGRFTSDLAGIQLANNWGTYRFGHLNGSLDWTRDYFRVMEARSDFYGGRINHVYSLEPLGTPKPATARWDVTYDNVDLQTFSEAERWPVLRLDGRITGRNVLVWPNGRFHERRGDGEIFGTPPGGVALAPRVLPAEVEDAPVVKLVDANKPLGPLAVGGHVTYHWFPEWLDVDDSWVASAHTYIALSGRTAYFAESKMPFHLTSTDWQESDRVLVAIMGAFHSTSSAIEVGGIGTFDGEMTSTFLTPHIAGAFAAERMRAWDVVWGPARGDIVVSNQYVDVTGGVIGGGASTVTADGRFSLGFPRKDHGEELDARIRVSHWDVKDLRTAFQLNDWPVEGVVSSDLHLYGLYHYPEGFGTLHFDNGVAWGEAFQAADGGLRFEPDLIRVDGITMAKGAGAVTGAAVIRWDGTYSFEAAGERIPVESLTRLSFPQAKLTGLLRFTASGAGEFKSPSYRVSGSIEDLFSGDEGIGRLTGDITLQKDTLAITLNASSPRLAASGGGTLRMAPTYDADVTFRFTDTSIDPYLRMLAPGKFEFVTAVVNGSVHITGDPTDRARLAVDATIDDASLKLFDYELHNDGVMRLAFKDNTVTAKPGEFKLKGDQTELQLSGDASTAKSQINAEATGRANLAVLQAFFGDVRSEGEATLRAAVTGDINSPEFSGQATIAKGRLRHYSMPQSLENVNGVIRFDKDGILLDGVHGTLGGGDITFDGRVGFTGFSPSEFGLTARGENMRLRYPKDFISTADADLELRGPIAAPLLTGLVSVNRTTYTRQFEAGAGLYGLLVPEGEAALAAAAGAGGAEPSAFPLRFDVRVTAPPISFIDDKDLSLSGHADLRFTGTLARIAVLGNVDIDTGVVVLLGNRYQVTNGSIAFTDPTGIQPFFDIEAETHVREPAGSGSFLPQDYRVVLRVTGPRDHLVPTCTSDPPLPQVDCGSLLLGAPIDLNRSELRTLGSQQDSELKFMQSMMAQLVAGAIYQKSGVGRVVELSGVDTVQITPRFTNDTAFQNLNATARITIGKRISPSVYLTYSQAVNASQSEVILLEYDQSDRISWIVSRNEDGSFAIDFRVRYRF